MSVKAKKELTGRHVLLMVVAFFAVIIAVNAYFITAAVQSFRGEDVPRSYRQGLEYNQTIAARATQDEMGWTVRINNVGKDIILVFQDSSGRAVSDLNITGKLRHPVDTDQDHPVMFSNEGSGHYRAQSVEASNGRWILVANAQNTDQHFKFESKLWE